MILGKLFFFFHYSLKLLSKITSNNVQTAAYQSHIRKFHLKLSVNCRTIVTPIVDVISVRSFFTEIMFSMRRLPRDLRYNVNLLFIRMFILE